MDKKSVFSGAKKTLLTDYNGPEVEATQACLFISPAFQTCVKNGAIKIFVSICFQVWDSDEKNTAASPSPSFKQLNPQTKQSGKWEVALHREKEEIQWNQSEEKSLWAKVFADIGEKENRDHESYFPV